MLVDDNELNREIAGEILQMTGTKVETAENGKIAVEKVEASPKGSYDLVFMDIQMPVMNGYEATAANQFSRTQLLLGEGDEEACRCQSGSIWNIVAMTTNLNRQIIATRKTVGKYKTDVMKERMLEINPDVKVETHKCFFSAGECRRFSI